MTKKKELQKQIDGARLDMEFVADALASTLERVDILERCVANLIGLVETNNTDIDFLFDTRDEAPGEAPEPRFIEPEFEGLPKRSLYKMIFG